MQDACVPRSLHTLALRCSHIALALFNVRVALGPCSSYTGLCRCNVALRLGQGRIRGSFGSVKGSLGKRQCLLRSVQSACRLRIGSTVSACKLDNVWDWQHGSLTACALGTLEWLRRGTGELSWLCTSGKHHHHNSPSAVSAAA